MGVKRVVAMTDGDWFDHLRAAPPSGRGRLLVAVGPILPGAPTGRVVPVQIVRAAPGALLPELAGEGGPRAGWGYGPLLQTEPDCTDISGNLRLSTPASPLRGEGGHPATGCSSLRDHVISACVDASRPGGVPHPRTDNCHRMCAVSRERTLPALEAAHIRPFAEGGEHEASNGVLLGATSLNLNPAVEA